MAKQPTETASAEPKPGRRLPLKLLAAAVCVVLLAVALLAQHHHAVYLTQHPEVVARQNAQAIVKQVSKHVELPAAEQPTIATVTDISKLSNQVFFKDAKQGDKVLIYGKAKLAVLYRQNQDEIINVSSLNLGGSQ